MKKKQPALNLGRNRGWGEAAPILNKKAGPMEDKRTKRQRDRSSRERRAINDAKDNS